MEIMLIVVIHLPKKLLGLGEMSNVDIIEQMFFKYKGEFGNFKGRRHCAPTLPTGRGVKRPTENCSSPLGVQFYGLLLKD